MAKTNHTDIDREDLAYRIGTIRNALHVGLASYGEIERLDNAQEIHELSGQSIPEGLRVMHPTGASDTVIQFADALRFLDQMANA